MGIPRGLEEAFRRCPRCDHYKFKRRDSGPWAYCLEKKAHFPVSVTIATFTCEGFTFGGIKYSELTDEQG